MSARPRLSSEDTIVTHLSHHLRAQSIPLPPMPKNTIPEEHTHRTLVLCFDGTGDQFDRDNGNVIEFFSMLKKDNRMQQIVYYQPGIGTYLGSQRGGTVPAKLKEMWDEAVAWGLSDHVKEGYRFLMQNYIVGDKISLIGFSRGAYTARALAGMLHKVGLLPPGNAEQIHFAYKIYARTDKKSWDSAALFKDSFAINVMIDFIGVWDTVRSVGVLDTSLPFSSSNNCIRTFRQALALDEHRTKFQANHWNPVFEPQGDQYDEEDLTDWKEVWFAGVHTDVGGGSVQNGTPHSLAKITLRWMVKECFRCNTGIMFDVEKLFKQTGLTPTHLTEDALISHSDRDPSTFNNYVKFKDAHNKETEVYTRESRDLVRPGHDQLAIKWWWWLLELLPLRRSLPPAQEEEITEPLWRLKRFAREHPVNHGKGREIPLFDSEGNKIEIYVHHTVNQRMLVRDYVPKASNWKGIEDRIIWTD